MSQTKAQLIQPIGIVTAGGVVVTGVVTASSFDGDVVGTATSIISGGNLNLGDVNATTFSGDFTGNATGINTGADIKVGSFTATSFTGDFTGTATSMMRGTGFEAGAVNATGFNVSGTSAGNITGNVTGNITGNVTGVATGNVTGNVTGNITGYAKSVTSGANIHVGVLTAITFSGDGSNLSGIAATNYNTQTVTANAAETIIDLADGNMITMNQSANTTVGFASTSTSMEVTIIRVKPSSWNVSYSTGRVDFDGTDDTLTIAASNDFVLDGDFTIEGWFYPQGYSTYNALWCLGSYNNAAGIIFYQKSSNGNLELQKRDNDDGGYTTPFSVTAPGLNVWTHVAVARSGSTITVYLNGESQGSWTDSDDWGTNTNKTFQIGSALTDSGNDVDFWNGIISNFRLVKGTAVYTADFVPPTAALTNITNTKLLCCQSTSDVTAAAVTPGTITKVSNPTADSTTVSQSGTVPTSVGTITWPDSVKWDGGTAPTLISKSVSGDSQQFQLITRDSGLTWYGWEPYNRDVATYTAFGWSTAGTGSLGQNNTTNYSSPIQLGAAGNWKQVDASGTNRSALIDSSNNLWVMGDNQYGGLGQNQPVGSHVSSPIQIPGTWSLVTQASMGGQGIKDDGTLWAWGLNQFGMLAQNNTTNLSSPTQVGTDTTWSSNINHLDQTSNTDNLAIKTDGSLWMWGRNDMGVAGQNNRTQYSSPVQVGTDTTWQIATFGGEGGGNCFAIKTDGTLWSWGYESYGYLGLNSPENSERSSPTQVGTDTNWADVGGGDYASCATKTDGTLWTWGSNAFGELGGNFSGNGSMSTNSRSSPIQIPGTTWVRPWSGRHMMGCLKTDGTWWGWGSNYYGGLGLNQAGSPGDRFSSPVQLPGTWATARETIAARKHNGAWSMKE